MKKNQTGRALAMGLLVLVWLFSAGALAEESVPALGQTLKGMREGAIAPDAARELRARGLALKPSAKVLGLGRDGVGEAFQLEALVKPEGAVASLRYTSSNARVASVDEDGRVTAHKLGKAVITCRTMDNSKLKRTCKVTVKGLAPKALTLDAPEVTLAPNASVKLSATVSPANAYNPRVQWKSANPKVAKVSQDGVVTALSMGMTKISARTSVGGVTASLNVTVGFADSDIYYLAIGEEKYQYVSALKGPRVDVNRFVKALSASRFGQKSLNGQVFYDLTSAQLRSAIANLPALGMDENDVTYLYYSGHGVGGSDRAIRGALAGVDYTMKSPERAVTVDEIRTYLDKVPGTVVLVIDACLSGQFITPKGGDAAGNAVVDGKRFEQSFVEAFSGAGKASAKGIGSIITGNPQKGKYKLLVASAPMQNSYVAESGVSVFTDYVTQAAGILGSGEGYVSDQLPADANRNHWVSLKEIYRYAMPKILKWSKSALGKPQQMMVWPANDNFPIFARQ
ncbi:MAG: Ig-like domain-containing protein [Clostridia bacterium]